MGEPNNLSQTENESLTGRYLTFKIDEVDYGIEISYVTEIIMEIIEMYPITDVPEVPAYIKGIINLRGKIVPVMDVRTRFSRPIIPYDDRTCVIVVDAENTSIGLIVDTVCGVLDIGNEQITEPAEKQAGYGNRYIRGIGKTPEGIKMLLDLESLVGDKSL